MVSDLFSMNTMILRTTIGGILLVIITGMLALGVHPIPEYQSDPIVSGLDHIPVVVVDLASAAESYRKLGFTLKPGREHENGIQNLHIKFADGTEIELITANKAADPLTTEYIRLLTIGEGAAFVGFYSSDLDQLATRFSDNGRHYDIDGGLLTFPRSTPLRYIFFGQRIKSPTDTPKHFEHQNGAEALIGVWIAGENLESERQLFSELDIEIHEDQVHSPDRMIAEIAQLPQAEVILLPGSSQLLPGRKIIGATLRTQNLEALQAILNKNSWSMPPIVQTSKGQSLFLPPSMTHGIWLEFRQWDD
jgi:hypothetical protein